MSKLKKMLLISSLIALSSCADGIPDPPNSVRITPIWKNTNTGAPEVSYFYGRTTKDNAKFSLTNRQAYDVGLECTDLDSRNKMEAYLAEMERLIQRRCK